MIYMLVAGLALWMFGCAFAGFYRRYKLFFLIVAIGMALNTVWMVIGLDAKPLGGPALMAHSAALIYAFCALGAGFLAGRIAKRFHDSKVNVT